MDRGGIRRNSVHPGAILTDIQRAAVAKSPDPCSAPIGPRPLAQTRALYNTGPGRTGDARVSKVWA